MTPQTNSGTNPTTLTTSADQPANRAPLRLGWFSTGRGEGSRGLLTATLDAIDSELDAAKRKQLSQDLERKMIDLAWYVVIGGSKTVIVYASHVKTREELHRGW